MKISNAVISKYIGLIFILFGGYSIVQNWSSVPLSSVIMVAVGIFFIIIDTVLNPNEPNDERVVNIKKQSGYMSYLFNLAYMVFIIL